MHAAARYSPGWGLSWQIWRRNRWGFWADIAWLAALALAARLLPESWRIPEVGKHLGVAASAVYIHLMAVFTYGAEVDLAAPRQSGIPARMFTLPLATRTLVAWPVGLGIAATTMVWLTVAFLILRPCGIEAPLALPMAVAATMLLAIQTVSWAPFEFGWARIVVMLPLSLAIFFAPFLSPLAGISESRVPLIYLASMPGLFWAAVASVSRARRGDAYTWNWRPAMLQHFARLLPERRRPFASAARAQLWFECRRHAGSLPIFMALMLVPAGVVLFFGLQNRGFWAEGFRIVAIIMAVPAFLAGILSQGLGKHDFSSKSFAMPAFLATRPISSSEFVAAKFKMAAVSTLLTWLVTLVLPAIWLLVPINATHLKQAFAEWSAAVGPGRLTAGFLLAAVCLPALTWKKLIDGMFVGLTGRPWFAAASGVVLGVLFVGVLTPAGLVLQLLPEYRPLAWRLLPWLIGAAVAAKAVAAVFLLRVLGRSKLLAPTALKNYLAFWFTITAALAAASMTLAPAGSSVWMAIAGAALVVPLNRLAAAPLALNWNRHR